MRFYIFLCGLLILATGGTALFVLEKNDAQGILYGAVQLGGAILICGIFSIRMKWHGVIGAGIVALLGAAKGLTNVPGMVKFLAGERPRGAAPLLEMGVTLISMLLLFKVLRALAQERVRRMLESEK